MSIRLLFLSFIALLASPFLLSHAHAELRDLPSVTVFSSSSLSEPLTQISKEFSKKYNITVTASYDSTPAQEGKIERGETCDLFISAHSHWINSAKQKGLIDVYSVTDLFTSKLALVISTSGRLSEYPVLGSNIYEQIEFLSERSIMSIGEPNRTAIGKYTRQFLENISFKQPVNLWHKLRSKTMKSYSSKNNLYLISKGETSGITFYSDTIDNDEIRIIALINEELHDPITYKAAIVAGQNMENAKKFLDFMQGDFAVQTFKKYGLSQ